MAAKAALQIKMPPEFRQQEVQNVQFSASEAYTAPKVAGDPDDGYVSLSPFATRIPLENNLARWCSQFELPAGKTCETGMKQETLEGAAHPTTVVEIAGTYKGSPMMGPWKQPQKDFAMIVAEIVAPDQVYYVKLLGPQKTVDHWREPFISSIKAAK
jgi:hypothetical protein